MSRATIAGHVARGATLVFLLFAVACRRLGPLSTIDRGCTAPVPSMPFFDVVSVDRENRLYWVNPPSGASSTRVLFRTDGYPRGIGDSRATVLGDFPGTPGAVGTTSHRALVDGTTYYYAAFAGNAAGKFSCPRTSFGRPDSPSSGIRWAYTAGGNRPMRIGVNVVYQFVSGDFVLHGLAPGPDGVAAWLAGSWKPVQLGTWVRDRPAISRFTATSVMGSRHLVRVSSRDGRVRAFDGDTGRALWTSPELGRAVDATVSSDFREFGGVYDLHLVGSRGRGRTGAFYGLDIQTGAIRWKFDNGGGAAGLGAVPYVATVVRPTSRVYFTSRRRAGVDTLWCLDFTDTSATKVWSADVGDPSGSPSSSPDPIPQVVYVANRMGEVRALDAATGAARWAFQTNDGRIRGFVWVDGGRRRYFATQGHVQAIRDDGTSASPLWTVAIPRPSQPIVGGGRLYVSGGDGRLYSLDPSAANPTATSIVLGDPTVRQRAGDITLDAPGNMALVATDRGVVYGVPIPF